MLEVLADFKQALKADKQAFAFFEALSFSNNSRHVLNIEGAKSQETCERRIAKSVAQLHDGLEKSY